MESCDNQHRRVSTLSSSSSRGKEPDRDTHPERAGQTVPVGWMPCLPSPGAHHLACTGLYPLACSSGHSGWGWGWKMGSSQAALGSRAQSPHLCRWSACAPGFQRGREARKPVGFLSSVAIVEICVFETLWCATPSDDLKISLDWIFSHWYSCKPQVLPNVWVSGPIPHFK